MTENGSSCPVCKGFLEKGYIQSSSRIAWTPKLSQISAEPMFQKEAVLLSEQNRFSINHVEALLCRKCKKVIIDY